jgi:phosphoribosylformylglycinamidine cyclo-ligase
MKGLVKGAQEANVAIIGGETAILPEIIKEALDYSGFAMNGFDLAATCIGVVDENKIITGKGMKVNDVVIGLESSGLHSNGYTLARKVLSLNQWGEELLTPTRIYVRLVLEILKKVNVHGIAHITGGAFSKLNRLGKAAKKGFLLDNLPKPPRIFNEIQKEADVDDREMYSVFNMGVGLCIVAAKRDANTIISICEKHGCKASVIGRIIGEERVEIRKDEKSLIL